MKNKTKRILLNYLFVFLAMPILLPSLSEAKKGRLAPKASYSSDEALPPTPSPNIAESNELPGIIEAPEAVYVSETSFPSANGLGIAPSRLDYTSFVGSNPQTLISLIRSLSYPLPYSTSAELTISQLLMPAAAGEEEKLPEHWLEERVKKLMSLGAYQKAVSLLKNLPKKFLSETLALYYVDALLIQQQIAPACQIVKRIIDDENTSSNLLWPLRLVLCHRLAGKHDEAELILGILREKVSSLPPATIALLETWQTTETLPALDIEDLLHESLFITALNIPNSTVKERFKAPVVGFKDLHLLPVGLAKALGEQTALPGKLRLKFLKIAAVKTSYDPRILRQLVRHHTTQKGLPVVLKKAIEEYDSNFKPIAVLGALDKLRPTYGPNGARHILAPELHHLTDSHIRYYYTPRLTMELAAFHLSQGNEKATNIVERYTARQSSRPDLQILQLPIMQAQALDKALQPRAQKPPRQTGLPPKPAALSMESYFIMRRFISVKRALGHPIPSAWQHFTKTGPFPRANRPGITWLEDLRKSAKYNLQGETVLRIIQLLQGGDLAYVSDEVLEEMIASLKKVGLHKHAWLLARDAILNSPFEVDAEVETSIKPEVSYTPSSTFPTNTLPKTYQPSIPEPKL